MTSQAPKPDDEAQRELELLAERARVEKQQVRVGQVSFVKQIFESVSKLDIELAYDELDVTREAMDRPALPDEGLRVEDEVIRIPVIVERPVVVIQRFVIEEIVIRRRTRTRTEHLEVPVRHEALAVEDHPDDLSP